MNLLIEGMLVGKTVRSYKIAQCCSIFPEISDQAEV